MAILVSVASLFFVGCGGDARPERPSPARDQLSLQDAITRACERQEDRAERFHERLSALDAQAKGEKELDRRDLQAVSATITHLAELGGGAVSYISRVEVRSAQRALRDRFVREAREVLELQHVFARAFVERPGRVLEVSDRIEERGARFEQSFKGLDLDCLALYEPD